MYVIRYGPVDGVVGRAVCYDTGKDTAFRVVEHVSDHGFGNIISIIPIPLL